MDVLSDEDCTDGVPGNDDVVPNNLDICVRDDNHGGDTQICIVCNIFTARKRSLGQGNIFIGVCQEFCSQGGLPGRRTPRQGDPRARRPPPARRPPQQGDPTPEGAPPRMATAAGGTHPTGMHFYYEWPFSRRSTPPSPCQLMISFPSEQV